VSATRERQIPLQRIVTIASLVRETQTKKVLVCCRSHGVAKQYRRGVRSAGGRTGNLRFLIVPDMPRSMRGIVVKDYRVSPHHGR